MEKLRNKNNKMKDLKGLEEKIGVEFSNKDFLLIAVVHRSYLNEHSEYKLDHNERQEFLGDAVLELIVTEYLFNNYHNPEGELTNWRAALVNSEMLAVVAEKLSIEEYIHMSKGEDKDKNSKARHYILANSVEAIIGAIYLDKGYDVAKKFILDNFIIHLEEILEKQLYKDPKSKFQEISQEKVGITPSYKVLEESGPDHDKKFVVGLYLGKEKVSEGEGTSKQEAQVDAAAKGLENKGW